MQVERAEESQQQAERGQYQAEADHHPVYVDVADPGHQRKQPGPEGGSVRLDPFPDIEDWAVPGQDLAHGAGLDHPVVREPSALPRHRQPDQRRNDHEE